MYSYSEVTPKAERQKLDYESGQKPAALPRKSRAHSIQSIDYSFIDSTPKKKPKAYLGPISNINKSCRHTLIIELLSYASTPPRPILSSESDSIVLYEISSKGSEFNLLTEYCSKRIMKVTKIFIYAKIASLPRDSESLSFLSNNLLYNKVRMLFVSGEEALLKKICDNDWNNIEVNPRELLLSSSLAHCERISMRELKSVLVVVAAREALQKLDSEVYVAGTLEELVPVYLIEFNLL